MSQLGARAFEALVRNFGGPVRGFLRRRADPDTAEDVFAETMLVAWRRLEDNPSDQLPWLYVTARTCVRNAERASRRQERLVRRIQAVDPPTESQPPPDADGNDSGQVVRAVIARMRPADAEVLRLWAWEDLGPADIATVLGVSVNAATVRLHRAKKKLRTEDERTSGAGGHNREKGGVL